MPRSPKLPVAGARRALHPRPPLRALCLLGALGLAGCEALSAGAKGEDTAGAGDGAGADTGAPAGWEPGVLALSDGTTCAVDDTAFGFCGASSSAVWGDSSTALAEAPCPVELRATVWMHPETGPAGEAHTLSAAADHGPGEASVWFELDGAAMVSAAGTAQAVREAPDRFAITFEAPALLDFVSGEALGLGASGRVLCQP